MGIWPLREYVTFRFPERKVTSKSIVLGNFYCSCLTVRLNSPFSTTSLSFSFKSTSNARRVLQAISNLDFVSIIRALPLRLSLLRNYFGSGNRRSTIPSQQQGHLLGIGGTQVGLVSCLTALLQLGGEHRDGDGGQDGDDRDDDQQLGQGKALIVVLLQFMSSFLHVEC